MSANPYQPHVLVLPEDDANRQLANGFLLDQSLITRRIQVLEPVGGWVQVIERFCSDHLTGMNSYPERFMVLLVDFDGDGQRLQRLQSQIPESLKERVFILGSLTNPEALKRGLGSYETIGLTMASDCRHESNGIWDHELLRNNASELIRLKQQVRPILFRPNGIG
jgi:hypothetical protein